MHSTMLYSITLALPALSWRADLLIFFFPHGGSSKKRVAFSSSLFLSERFDTAQLPLLLAFLCRSPDFIPTQNFTLLCLTQVNWFREYSTSFWRLSFSIWFTACMPFTLSHSAEHYPPCLITTAGSVLARASSLSPVMIAHSKKELYKRHCLSSLTRYCWIGLLPIIQDSPLSPPVGVKVVSQSQCGWSSK